MLFIFSHIHITNTYTSPTTTMKVAGIVCIHCPRGGWFWFKYIVKRWQRSVYANILLANVYIYEVDTLGVVFFSSFRWCV